MKAAIIKKLGEVPKYESISDPLIQEDNQLLLTVKASAVKNLDKIRAEGNHYAAHKVFPAIVGTDGVGTLNDGTKVYAQGITGMIAEKAIVAKNRFTVIPENLDFLTAAALPNAILGSVMSLKIRGKIKPGQNVLINGATGVTGQMAVQLAKHYGANTIISTGRNQKNLEKTKSLGATQTVSLKQEQENIIRQLKEIHQKTPIDLVIDYLWGNPIELVIESLKGSGLDSFTHQTKIVSVGSIAGENITLPSGTLRSSGIELLGSGFGSFSQEELKHYTQEILPEMFQLAANGKLTMELVEGKIENIESLWQQDIEPGKRLVISIN